MKCLRFLIAVLCCLFAFSAYAQEWQLIVSDRNRRIEIDAGHIINSDKGTKVAWSRAALSGQAAREAGYSVVKALNRYDCLNRSFSTIRRVYLDSSGKVLREEVLNDAVPELVARNSVDERMWREVCRPPDMKDMAEVVKAVEQATKGQVKGQVVAAPAGKGVEARPVSPPSAAQLNASVKNPAVSAAVREDAAVKPVEPSRQPVPVTKPAAKPAQPVVQKAPAATAPKTPPAVAEKRPARQPAVTAPSRKDEQSSHVAVARPVSQAADIKPETDWQYQGAAGPESWGALRPEWEVCMRGQRQAPIDLTNAIKVELEPVEFDFRSSRLRIVDTGKMLRAYVETPMDIVVRGEIYTLESLTLHRPADVLIDGRAADMSVQFLLRSANGKMAVLMVLLEQGEQPSALLQKVLNNLPLEKGEQYMPSIPFDLAGSIPPDSGHYLFMGSLPEPPCTEGVIWVVMRQPLSVSADQLEIMDRLYPYSARPAQPANGRLILQSR